MVPTARPSKSILIALYVNAGLLALIAVALLNRGSPISLDSAAFAQQQQPIAGGAGLFITPAQFSSNTFGCYLMDVDAQTLCAYQFLPGDKNLKLIAARNFRFDRRLDAFNTTPDPTEVKGWLDKKQAGERNVGNAPAPVSPEAPKE